jgi:hypothetical protein
VVLSHEHSAARWIDPWEFRDRYFNDDVLKNVAATNERFGAMLQNIRSAIDAYLDWRKLAGS